MRLFLIDPSLKNQLAYPSTNLGDLVIARAVLGILNELFPGADIERASSHAPLSEKQREAALAADLVLIGGSNLLSSHIMAYNQWKLYPETWGDRPPEPLAAVLFGVGWWQYQDAPDAVTSAFYRSVLSDAFPHSVRDAYTESQLRKAGIAKVLNTSCPTLWTLDGHEPASLGKNSRCLCCLTDYNPDRNSDQALLTLLLERYDQILFFPQGAGDEAYVRSLERFQTNERRFRLLPHDVETFYRLSTMKNCDYIGTRLHAGAWCLQQGLPTLILAVDNRSLEIARDTNLPVVDRQDIGSIGKFLAGRESFKAIRLPLQNIAEWKERLLEGLDGNS